MSTAVPALPVDDGTMAVIAGRLIELGVVSDEDMRWLTRGGMRSYLDEVERDVRSRGYEGGRLVLHGFDRGDEGWAMIAYDADAFPSPSSAERAWEQARFERERQKTEVRADDWIARLAALRRTAEAWTRESSGLSIVDRSPVEMFEDEMHRYGLGPRSMPVFDILKDGRPSLRFSPRGLWTLGENGLVDLITPKSSPVLVDRAEPLSGPPDWTAYDPSDRSKGWRFGADLFTALVETGRLP